MVHIQKEVAINIIESYGSYKTNDFIKHNFNIDHDMSHKEFSSWLEKQSAETLALLLEKI